MRTRATCEGWITKPEDRILQGTPTDLANNIFRAVGEWMRGLGWQTKKTNHALRAYAGSQIAMRYGMFEAQSWLRHASVQTTETHYSYFVNAFRPADIDTLPARWTTAAAPFVSQVVASA
jgi:integrase